jgi:hypothetical protein
LRRARNRVFFFFEWWLRLRLRLGSRLGSRLRLRLRLRLSELQLPELLHPQPPHSWHSAAQLKRLLSAFVWPHLLANSKRPQEIHRHSCLLRQWFLL